LPSFGFYFHGIRPFPSKEEYFSMLEDYKRELEEELEEELKEAEKEIEEIRKSS
jgi:F0F1-type ATP synthase membrane subunit b/b'